MEQKEDQSVALNTAFASAKELVNVVNQHAQQASLKQEAAFTKQMDSLGNTMTLGINNLRESISELKTFQSKDMGSKEGVKDFRDWIPWIITIAMFVYAMYKAS